MNHLEHPPRELWEERRRWFEAVEESARGEVAYLVSEQACALSAEVQATFSAGAWGAVIVLAMAVVDAALREAELPGFKGNTKELIDAAGANSQLQSLRLHRNALGHLDSHRPALTFDQQCSAAPNSKSEHERRSN